MDYLLDTNHCIYLINGLDRSRKNRTAPETNLIDKIQTIESDIFMSEATLGELYFGAANSTRKDYNYQRIDIFKQAVIPISVDAHIWWLFGDTKAALRKRGKAITDIDLLIACTAKVYDLVLVTNDHDFECLPADFNRENWV